MQTATISREQLPDGRIKMSAGRCSFLYNRLRPGVLLVTITGVDSGQFGHQALDEIRMELLRYRPLELLVDAREAAAASSSVSDEWTRFFALNQEHLKRVRILVGSKVLYLTVSIAQHLSRTGNLIQIYSDPAEFETLLKAAQAGNKS